VADAYLQGEVTTLQASVATATSFALLTENNKLIFDSFGNPIWMA
jgi:hypothetical protein